MSTEPASSVSVRTPATGWLERAVERGLRIAGGVSIRTKILGMVLALTTVLGLSVTWQVRTSLQGILRAELGTRGEAVVSDLAARSVDPILLDDLFGLHTLLTDTVSNHPDAVYAFVVDGNGKVLAHTFGDEGIPAGLLDLRPSVTSTVETPFVADDRRMHDFAAPIFAGRAGVAHIGFDEARLAATIDDVTAQLLLTTIGVGLAGIAAAIFLTWLLTRPVLDLVRTTEAVGSGDLTARAEPAANDEIGALATAFNQMVEQLEDDRELIDTNERARTHLLDQLIVAQEEERKRIARELHDGVGQALSSLKLGITLLASQPDGDTAAELAALADETLTAVRQLGRELRPSALDDLGLAAALERHVETFRTMHPGITVDLHCEPVGRLDPHVETSLYRMVQEAMTNAARHGHPRNISVVLARRDGLVRAIVEDDGHGFDVDRALRAGSSVGLHGMTERADLVGGSVEFESGPGGTTVYIEVPG